MKFNLRSPCKDCPFRAEGAIHLERGRLAGIVKDLHDDYNHFLCHKTVHHPKGGEWDDDGGYTPSGEESVCIGATAFMMRQGYIPIVLRLALMRGEISREEIEAVYPELVHEVAP